MSKGHLRALVLSVTAAGLFGLGAPGEADAQSCNRTITAKVVAMDQPLMFNRLGAQNVNGMMFALRHDVVDKTTGKPEAAGGTLSPGNVMLRPDKRPRPLVLRAAVGDCLTVELTNLLAPVDNPFQAPEVGANGVPFNIQIDDQVVDRHVGFHPQGLELVGDISSDSSFVGRNPNSLADVGQTRTYKFYAPAEGAFMAWSHGATIGSEGSGGNTANGLWGVVNIHPSGAGFFRSQTTEEDLRLASADSDTNGFPEIDYQAVYPNAEPWISEGKAGLPILSMLTAAGEYVHSDINAIVGYTGGDFVLDGAGLTLGRFPDSTFPLERVGKRNPTVPNRLEPYREFTVAFHDEVTTAQAFPAWFADPVLGHTLHGVRDSFMINYGSGGIGSEIIANRLGVGPMHDCLDCAYEEFFLTAYTVGDVGMLVDVPANVGLEACDPALNNCLAVGPKATTALYPDDPSNVHHSYTGDPVSFRNLHAGPKEQHIFHLHNHQWLFNASDDNSNYLDAQGIGPGSGYAYNIAFGGSGNRNKTAGDAIFHCHFYPHFAQGMWEMWRIHDVLETGTELAASAGGFHGTAFELGASQPAAGARALPDGEILAGTPIPAVIPLPGRPMAPLPGRVEVVQKDVNGDGIAESSQAKVIDRDKNPGFPFWIAGIEDVVGQRVPTPPLDMDPVAGGVDGGLPRHALEGYAAGGASLDTQNRLDFSKVITAAKPVYYPEDGTQLEKVAMAFHAERCHSTYLADGTPADCDPLSQNDSGKLSLGGFITNGAPATPGAPYNDPCIDDEGDLFLTGQAGDFLDGYLPMPGEQSLTTVGVAEFGADDPRIYQAAVIQTDVVLNKTGYHFPQQRIIVLNEDVAPTLDKTRPPEPFVIRLNTFDCARFLHTNLVPEVYELDDYQVRTPTDIIGQHIHLPKWDLTSADGSANGWNYEDGTLSPGMVRERIEAINHFNEDPANTPVATLDGRTHLEPEAHPFFGAGPNGEWMGARTTIQRWFADPVVNVEGEDRGLGIIFTHDHYGPSTHQQVGLYATVLIEPAKSQWVHNETGQPMYTRPDGGPTSWQAAILADTNGDGRADEGAREFYFEFADFQHAYQPGVFVGVGADGHTVVPPTADSFRDSINPSVKVEIEGEIYPDVFRYPPVCPGGVPRPCPEAISAEDPGMLVVNYRAEPVGLRVFDPRRRGPDRKRGTQATGSAGDLANALQTRTDRAIAALNTELGDTPYPPLTGDLKPGDPFTPMMRSYAGDTVRVKVQTGAHEEEHNVSVHGVKWLQAGSGHGEALNSGWRNSQAAGISEQFTIRTPVNPDISQRGNRADYAYSTHTGMDGWWSGTWGLLRSYGNTQNDLFALPDNRDVSKANIVNASDFNGVCPVTAPLRQFDVLALLVNDLLENPLGVTIVPGDSSATMHEGGPLDSKGGTLVYNSRATSVSIVDELGNVVASKAGPLHDPTGILYVQRDDLVPAPKTGGERSACDRGGVIDPQCPVKLKDGLSPEPLVLRAAAGDCIEVTLRNRLPAVVPDLASLNTFMGVVPRDRFDPEGMTTFHNNLVRPSSQVGLHPQLVEYDVTRDDGTMVGTNPNQLAEPDGQKTNRWYAGDLRLEPAGAGAFRLVATPVEFGGTNLMPADKLKQGQKGLMGALIVEPQGSTWVEDPGTRTAATVTRADGTRFRDLAVVMQKGQSHRYADATAIENIEGGLAGIAEDSQDMGQMAVNFGTEPLWFRFGIGPNAPFGKAGFGGIPNAHQAYSNALVGGDPETPVFTANVGDEVLMRILMPHGIGRGTTFNLHGHVWQRDPYVCPNSADLGLPGKCAPGEVGSRAIGANPIGMYLGHQESVNGSEHFEVRLPSAGGAFRVPGDYLFRDQASFGNLSGVWGIMRVGGPQGTQTASQ